ncbi:MAG: amidophosphoribosyltransferase [Lysobacterales bacterium]|jgi:amidophosphoribosyltransferase
MCGIIGVSNHADAANIVYSGLYALQHRGEEAAGISSFDGSNLHTVKSAGLVADVFDDRSMAELKGKTAIGHCRYSTTGSSSLKNIQPFYVRHRGKSIAIAHNGNLTNTEDLHKKLEDDGALFQTSMDSELIVHLLAHSSNGGLMPWFKNVAAELKGAFSLIFLVDDSVVGIRDPQGFRPLCLGKLDGSYILASESCALDLVRAEFVRDIEPGEVVVIKGDSIESSIIENSENTKRAHCIFENIYFSRPDSNIFKDSVYGVRKRLGAQLAKEHPVKDVDFVMSIPDSGNYAALGYAKAANLPYEVGIIRNHYIGRTFIQPTQLLRDLRVRIKLNPIASVLKGKKILIVEDSIVRGTTSRSRIEELRRAGAKEIHMRISCPPIVSPCFYGIDFPSKEELIGATKSVQEIADFIKVDSLEYLSVEGMLSVMKEDLSFCDACFTGNYPSHTPTTKSKFLLEG